MDDTLRAKVIRLAYTKPEMRSHLLTVLGYSKSPSSAGVLHTLNNLSQWDRQGTSYHYMLPLEGNSTMYALVPAGAEAWYALVRMEHGKGRGDRLFILPGGGVVGRKELAEKFPSIDVALKAVLDHAVFALRQWELKSDDEPVQEPTPSMWSRWFGRTADDTQIVLPG